MIKVPNDASFKDVAEAALTEHVDNEEAREEMLRWLKDNYSHAERLQDEIYLAACNYAMREYNRNVSRAIRGHTVHPKGKETKPRVDAKFKAKVAIEGGMALMLLKIGGKTYLKDSKRKEIAEDAHHSRISAAGGLERALFLESVASGMNGRQTAGRRYKEDDLQKMHTKAEKDAKNKLGLDAA